MNFQLHIFRAGYIHTYTEHERTNDKQWLTTITIPPGTRRHIANPFMTAKCAWMLENLRKNAHPTMWGTVPEMSHAPRYSTRNVFCVEYAATRQATARHPPRQRQRPRNRPKKRKLQLVSSPNPSQQRSVPSARTNTRFSDYWKPRRKGQMNNSLPRFHHSTPNRNIRARQLRQNHLQSRPGQAESKVPPHPFHSIPNKMRSSSVANQQSR